MLVMTTQVILHRLAVEYSKVLASSACLQLSDSKIKTIDLSLASNAFGDRANDS